MSPADWWMVGIAVLLAVAASMLVTAEAALSVFSVSRAQALADDGDRTGERLVLMTQDKAPFLNSVLLLRLIMEMSSTVLVGLVVFRHIEPLWEQLLITIGVMSLVSFMLWGVASRTIGRQHATTVLKRMRAPLSAIAKVLHPIAALLILLGNALTPGKGYSEGPFTTEAELRDFIDIAESNDIIEDDERRMIHSVFELGDTIVREVMVPRTDVVFVEAGKTLRQAMSLALRSGFSRIPVIGQDGVDDVVGVFFLKDCMRRVFDNEQAQQKELVSSVMREVMWVPDSKPVDELMQEMQRDHFHMVMVSDEFGGLAGLVTIEDILEEIVGEIIDEYDQELDEVIRVDDNTFRVSSRMDIDELAELFDLEIEEDDVETVGGLMGKALGMVPIVGSTIIRDGLEFTAERSTGRRKNQRTILVQRLAEASETTDKDTDDE